MDCQKLICIFATVAIITENADAGKYIKSSFRKIKFGRL